MASTISTNKNWMTDFIPNQGSNTTNQIARLEGVTLHSIPKGKANDSVLYSLKKAGELKGDFSFTSKEESLLREIFSGWKLGQHICLLDLLGVELYSQIESLCGQAEEKDQILCDFSAPFILIYLLFERTKPEVIQQIGLLKNEYKNRYYGSLERIDQKLRAVEKSLLNLVAKKREKFLGREQITNRLDEKMGRFKATLHLFRKCLGSNVAQILLKEKNLNYFHGASPLSEVSKDSFDHLKKYMIFVGSLFRSSEEKGFIGVGDVHLIMKAIIQHVENATGQQIRSLPKLLSIKQEMLREKALKGVEERIRAERGELTHEQWCKERQIVKKTNKPPEEFKEWLKQIDLTNGLLLLFIQDIKKTLERQALPALFPDYISREALAKRVYLNISALQKLELKEEAHPFRQKIREELKPFTSPFLHYFGNTNYELEPAKPTRSTTDFSSTSGIARTKQASSPVDPVGPAAPKETEKKAFERLEGQPFPKITFTERQSGPVFVPTDIPQTELYSLFFTMKGPFDAVLQEIDKKRAEILHSLEKVLLPLPPSERDMEELRQMVFEECIPLFHFSVFIADIHRLLELDPPSEIPEVLANLVELEGIDLSLSRHLPPLPAPTEEEIRFFEPAEEKQVRIAPPVPKNSVTLPVQIREPEPLDLETYNVRKVRQRLIKAGFTLLRHRGDHAIFKYQGTGPQVIVPISGELATGTARSIQKQAQTALASMNQKK